MRHPVDFRAAVLAGTAAGVLSTVAQIILWSAFTDALPAILFRDMRFAAAIVMGHAVLPPPTSFDWSLLLVATLVHFALAVVYALLLCGFVGRLRTLPALAAGAAFGLGLYAINMYGFTAVFPWFAASRDWITAAAHTVFGIAVTGTYRLIPARQPDHAEP